MENFGAQESSNALIGIPFKYFYILSLIAIAVYFYLIKFNFRLLIFRPFEFKLKENTNWGYIGYALVLVVRQIPFFIFLFYSLSSNNFKKRIILLFLLLIVSFPTSLSRGLMGVIYIPVLLTFFPVLKDKLRYVLLFIGGVLVLFPLLNNLRHWNEAVLTLNYDLFNTAHFDAFQNFIFLIKENYISWGQQLKGSVLFFMREINGVSNNGSGHIIGEKTDYSFLNVSMPLVGEGYINFGYFGVFLFLFLLAFLNVVLDKINLIVNVKYQLKAIYLVMLGYEFYLMRGDLLSSAKMLTSFTLSYLLVNVVFKVVCLKNKKFQNKFPNRLF
ncbi:hypothetical protein ACXGQW_03965 [Wenyingzhuangia sp. IMCC45533]